MQQQISSPHLEQLKKSPHMISCNGDTFAVIPSKSEQKNSCILDMAYLTQLAKAGYTLFETFGFDSSSTHSCSRLQ